MGAADAPVDEKATTPKPAAVGEFMKKAKAAPPRKVSESTAATTEEQKGEGVMGSSVKSKAAPASAKPVYESYQADE